MFPCHFVVLSVYTRIITTHTHVIFYYASLRSSSDPTQSSSKCQHRRKTYPKRMSNQHKAWPTARSLPYLPWTVFLSMTHTIPSLWQWFVACTMRVLQTVVGEKMENSSWFPARMDTFRLSSLTMVNWARFTSPQPQPPRLR